MHTFKTGEWVAIHNGDYSGDVTLRRVQDDKILANIVVPFIVLEAFVAEAVRNEKIGKLEQMAPSELLYR